MYISKLRHGTKCDECDGQKPNFLPLLARMLKNEVILTSKTCSVLFACVDSCLCANWFVQRECLAEMICSLWFSLSSRIRAFKAKGIYYILFESCIFRREKFTLPDRRKRPTFAYINHNCSQFITSGIVKSVQLHLFRSSDIPLLEVSQLVSFSGRSVHL